MIIPGALMGVTDYVYVAGVAANPDSITAVLYRWVGSTRSASGITVTCTSVGSGEYRFTWTNDAGFARTDELELVALPVVSGVTYPATVWRSHGSVDAVVPTAAAGAIGGLLTAPTTANTGLADVTRLLGTAWLTPGTAGTPDVNLTTTALGAIWNRLTSSLSVVGSIGKHLVDYLTGDIFARLGAPAGASIAADIAAVKAETATIVVDTNELQTDWANGGRLDLILDARASQTSVDDIPTNAELATALAAGVNVTQVDGSNLGTHGIGQFPADVRDWGGLGATIAIDADNSAPSVAVSHIHDDVISAAAVSAAAVTKIQDGLASQTSVNDLPTNSELATALAAADDAVLAAIAALNNLSAAQVNAEMLDVLNVDTFGELAAPPAASSTLRDKLTWIFMCHRNLRTETATQRKLFADNGSTLVGTEAVSDNGTTFTKEKVV